jgi:dUTP pyrophosphatase
LHNSGPEDFTVNHGDRIAQLVISPIFTPEVEEVTDLSDTERGAGGFGSTGK